jgi:hypothetical protein
VDKVIEGHCSHKTVCTNLRAGKLVRREELSRGRIVQKSPVWWASIDKALDLLTDVSAGNAESDRVSEGDRLRSPFEV